VGSADLKEFSVSPSAQKAVLYAMLASASVAAWSFTWTQSIDAPALSPYLVQALCGAAWTLGSAVSAFVMWISMMVAMMLPATAPTVDAFATIARRRRARGQPYTPTFVFIAGYCLAWCAFSAAATLAQWQLYRAALLTPAMENTSPLLAGAALLIAGLYQFTPVKHACLRACRGPLAVIAAHWREGHAGALRMGLQHGLICVGCCWAVMALMFCVSVMDLRWAATLAVYAAAEKLVPGGDTIVAPAFGSAALAGGAVLIGLAFF
jgi:predicted metal-binding membrane protein